MYILKGTAAWAKRAHMGTLNGTAAPAPSERVFVSLQELKPTANADSDISPHMSHYLLDSFWKADGESSGVNLIWDWMSP